MQTTFSHNNTHLTCPACGLLCDDIAQNATKIDTRGCAKALQFFSQASLNATPQMADKPCDLASAIQAASQLLQAAQAPILAGLSTDVLGFRAAFKLAQASNAAMQHLNHASLSRNLQVLQSTGWQTTTLTEVKNRADVLLCIGTDIVSHHPRFFERIIWADNALFTAPQSRKIIYIGRASLNTQQGKASEHLICEDADLPNVLATLNALLLKKSIKNAHIGKVNLAALQALADTLRNAQYAVLAWAAKDLTFAHAELTIAQITQAVATLNQTTRAAGLSLGSADGDTSVSYAHTWLSGATLPAVDLHAHDVCVWINQLSTHTPPPDFKGKMIVLGNANMPLAQTPDVFIPVATPALDCGGALFRVDGSVTLPLKKVRESNLPTLSEVMGQIEALL